LRPDTPRPIGHPAHFAGVRTGRKLHTEFAIMSLIFHLCIFIQGMDTHDAPEWSELEYARAAYRLCFQIMTKEQIIVWKQYWILEFSLTNAEE
jgi:hypothetical protein